MANTPPAIYTSLREITKQIMHPNNTDHPLSHPFDLPDSEDSISGHQLVDVIVVEDDLSTDLFPAMVVEVVNSVVVRTRFQELVPQRECYCPTVLVHSTLR